MSSFSRSTSLSARCILVARSQSWWASAGRLQSNCWHHISKLFLARTRLKSTSCLSWSTPLALRQTLPSNYFVGFLLSALVDLSIVSMVSFRRCWPILSIIVIQLLLRLMQNWSTLTPTETFCDRYFTLHQRFASFIFVYSTFFSIRLSGVYNIMLLRMMVWPKYRPQSFWIFNIKNNEVMFECIHIWSTAVIKCYTNTRLMSLKLFLFKLCSFSSHHARCSRSSTTIKIIEMYWSSYFLVYAVLTCLIF